MSGRGRMPHRYKGRNKAGRGNFKRGGGRSPNHSGERGNNFRRTNANTIPETDRTYPNHSDERGKKYRGTNANTIPEIDRIRYTKMLVQFRESNSSTVLEMPSDLTNIERKFMHELCLQLGLKSKSVGKKGKDRRITVRKIPESQRIASMESGDGEAKRWDDSLPRLKIGIEGREELNCYIKEFPPTPVEEAESRETGSSLLQSLSDEKGGAKMGYRVLDTLSELKINATSNVKIRNRHRTRYQERPEQRAARHHSAQRVKVQQPNYGRMQDARKKLPAYAYKEKICKIIQNNTVTILSGDTGCGKSTQVPQFLLDDQSIGPKCNIVVTQPRRISATSIAERVASERCEAVGNTVGYNVRLDSATSNSTQLLFVTPGILLRKFQSDPTLEEFTHIIIDEIHERDKYTEFLMIALRNLLNQRNDLRVILMSATIQTNELITYWSGAGHMKDGEDVSDVQHQMDHHKPAEVNIPGRTFPVQEFFLEDILAMTKFLNSKMGSAKNDANRIEADLSLLLEKSHKRNHVGDDDSSNHSKKKKISTKANTGNSLSCVMCNQSGFKCPEELGAHVALCNGGGKCNMLELEKKVRQIDTSTVHGFDETRAAQSDISENVFDECEFQGNNDMVGEEDCDIRISKWDGESPYNATNVEMSDSRSTFMENELLNLYQGTHDDDEVDSELLIEVVKYIDESSYGDGAILIFLPGWQEISEITMLLQDTPPFNNCSKFLVLPLHSGIPSRDQKRVFQRPAHGVRKIILSTNIAETSVTIDDVSFVVDSGKAKEKNYDPHLKSSTLQPVWVSQASAKQRKGRAGRTKPGVCFYLFSRTRHASLRPFLESELLRTSLEEICLQCKKLDLAPGGPDDDDGISAFLAAALSPPHPKAVSNAIELLVDLGAMEPGTNELTELGQCLSTMSLEPRVGKMVIWSYILGCARAASSMAVAMSYKSPFTLPPPSMRRYANEAKVEIADGSESDQVTILNALKARDHLTYRRGRNNGIYDYCRSNFINVATLNMISDLRRNVARELMALGFPDPSHNGWHNCNDGGANLSYLQATIAAGLYPNIATRRFDEINFRTLSVQKCKVHQSSVNSVKGQPLSMKCTVNQGELEFVAYGEMVRGVSSFTINQTTQLASGVPLVLLCGEFKVRPARTEIGKSNEGILSVDNWIEFKCEVNEASALAILRNRLNKVFLKFVSNPSQGMSILNNQEKGAVRALNVLIKSAFDCSPGRWRA